jgi:hypothetical protein
MLKIVGEYCEVSGVHGFQFLTGQWSVLERIFWLIILIVSFVVSGKFDEKSIQGKFSQGQCL